MGNIYVTGDTHGDNVARFSFKRHKELKDLGLQDCMFMLGDTGICWPGYEKQNIYDLDFMASKPWTFFLVRGNHDNYGVFSDIKCAITDSNSAIDMMYCDDDDVIVGDLSSDKVENYHWNESGCPFEVELGKVHRLCYNDKTYDNIYLINEACVIDVCGKHILIIPGAKSHDIDIILDPQDKDFQEKKRALRKRGRWFRIKNQTWWEKEDIDIEQAEEILKCCESDYFDFIFTHDCPGEMCKIYAREGEFRMAPTKAESYLESLRQTLNYGYWCFGHMHTSRFTFGASREWNKDISNLYWIWKDIDNQKNMCIYHDILREDDIKMIFDNEHRRMLEHNQAVAKKS